MRTASQVLGYNGERCQSMESVDLLDYTCLVTLCLVAAVCVAGDRLVPGPATPIPQQGHEAAYLTSAANEGNSSPDICAKCSQAVVGANHTPIMREIKSRSIVLSIYHLL